MNRLVGIPEPRVVTDSHWPQSADDALTGPPSLSGFVGSSFSPLVAAVADSCLRPVFGEPSRPPEGHPVANSVELAGFLPPLDASSAPSPSPSPSASQSPSSARCRDRHRRRLGTAPAGPVDRRGQLLRRRRGQRGDVAGGLQPGGALARPGAVRLREQRLRHHDAGALRGGGQHHRPGQGFRHPGLQHPRAGPGEGARGNHCRGGPGSGRQGSDLPGVPDASTRTTPSSTERV
jgi:hypothetical protein